MGNTLSGQGGGLGSSSQGAEGINNNFKIVKQVQAEHTPSLKNLAPNSKALREFGAVFDGDKNIGMTKVNTAESTKIQAGPEIGKGSLVDEVF